MKPVTLYVSDSAYASYQAAAALRDVKAAALIRMAMDYYLKEKLEKQKPIKSWQPLDLGTVLSDWKDKSFQEEMMDDRY